MAYIHRYEIPWPQATGFSLSPFMFRALLELEFMAESVLEDKRIITPGSRKGNQQLPHCTYHPGQIGRYPDNPRLAILLRDRFLTQKAICSSHMLARNEHSALVIH